MQISDRYQYHLEHLLCFEFFVSKFQGIRWCKSASGQIKTISLQEKPNTHNISRRKDRCTFMQQSDIFNRITNDDTDLEIMCELNDKYSTTSRKSRSNSLLYISTDIKGLTFW